MARAMQTRRLFIVLILACFGFGCLIAIVNLASIELDELDALFVDGPKLHSHSHSHSHGRRDEETGKEVELPKSNNGDVSADIHDHLDRRNPKIAGVLQMKQPSENTKREKEQNPVVMPDIVENQQNANNPPEQENNLQDFPEPNYNVHVFYYPWYGNPQTDGKYIHWNHGYIEHWNKREAKKWPVGRHQPPDDIGANFYPSLGCYSSRDPKIIEDHVKQIRSAGIGVLVVSWYPNDKSDAEGIPSDTLLPILLDTAHKYQLKVAIHSEPYKTRDDYTLHKDMKYLIQQYGSHPAFYKHKWQNKELPLIYVYDSYLVPAKQWAELLKPNGKHTVRGTEHDAIFIALLVEGKHKTEITQGGFDGFYTYFATNGFTFGSTYQHWKELSKFATSLGLMFIPSLGPGYIDTSIRPWNQQNTRQRLNGQYYKNAFTQALEINPEIISITSFNEWHEGTQIESAVPKQAKSMTYLDYRPNDPDFYLKMTKEWSEKYAQQMRKHRAH